MYSNVVGMYVNMDCFFPQKLSLTQTYRGYSRSIELSKSDYKSLWGISALWAPALKLVWKEKSLFTVSPGIHYQMLFAEAEYTSTTYLFGIGVNLQNSIFFSSNGYFNFGFDFAYDFLGKTVSSNPYVDTSSSGSGYDITFTPRLGIGFHF